MILPFWVPLLVWSFPLAIICMMLAGYLIYRFKFKRRNDTELLIMQITTVDNPRAVNRITKALADYRLSIPYKVWVVTESEDKYTNADLVVKVPKDFVSISHYKARALDYSTQLRKSMGLVSDKIKILYLDDDTIPSLKYIQDCFEGDYDIMEGIIQPKVNYGTRYSYIENMRTISCMSVCSIFQSHGHPVWVHGEGLCVRASIEQKLGWQFDIIASEDLCFGHRAATAKVSWGFTWTPIYITSPLNAKDYFKQRNRWIWGNIHAVSKILTKKSAIRLVSFYLIGSVFLLLSFYLIVQDILYGVGLGQEIRGYVYGTFCAWLSIYAFVGYKIGGKPKHVVCSMALAWFTAVMNTLPIWIAPLKGKPKKFEVIQKL